MSTRLMSLLFCALLLTISCKENTNESAEQAKDAETSAESGPTLPPLPDADRAKMMQQCDFIDYIWHELPFSISQKDPEAVKSNITFISYEGLNVLPTDCKNIGRKSYQIHGEIFYDADIYFGEGCYYYVFLRNEKPMFANKMTQEGINFYKGIFSQALQMRNKALGEQQQ